MAPLQRFGAFRRRLADDFGVTIEETAEVLVGPRGPGRIRYFQRVVGAETLTWPLPSLGDDDFVMWDVLRSICRALQIDPHPFGLSAG